MTPAAGVRTSRFLYSYVAERVLEGGVSYPDAFEQESPGEFSPASVGGLAGHIREVSREDEPIYVFGFALQKQDWGLAEDMKNSMDFFMWRRRG